MSSKSRDLDMPLKIENPNGPCFSDYTKKLGVVWKFWYKYRLSRNAGWLVPRVADAHCSAQTAYWLTSKAKLPPCAPPLYCNLIWEVLHCSTCSVHSIQIKRRIVSRLDKASREFPTTLTPPIPPTHPPNCFTHFQTFCCLAPQVFFL